MAEDDSVPMFSLTMYEWERLGQSIGQQSETLLSFAERFGLTKKKKPVQILNLYLQLINRPYDIWQTLNKVAQEPSDASEPSDPSAPSEASAPPEAAPPSDD